MKIGTPFAVSALFIALAVQAQIDISGLQQVSPDQLSDGTYWLAKGPFDEGPPPPTPFPPPELDVPIYSLGNGQFLVDDRSVDYKAIEVLHLLMSADSPPVPGDGDGEGSDTNSYGSGVQSDFTTNDLWLQIAGITNPGTTSATANLVIHLPWNVTNGVYDLFYSTNLAAPVSWNWLLRSDPGQTNLTVQNATGTNGFYRLGLNELKANSSLGTNFWLAFFNMIASVDSSANLSLYISSPLGATGTVTIPLLGTTTNFSVAAGAVTNIQIDQSIMMSDYEAVETNGIHITASQPVSVYGFNYDPAASAGFTCYPTPLLGTNYCLMARPTNINAPGYPYGSQFAIVATADSTTVNITPSSTAGLPETGFYTIMLNQGQTYQAISGDTFHDVTGTLVSSDKPVAVFAGANIAFVNADAGNPLVQEQLPVDSWGTQALSLSFAGRSRGDSYRVLTLNDNTVVTITSSNGVIVVTNQVYDIIIDGPVEFKGSQPIQVAKFSNGLVFDGAEGDPCEILLLPTGHYLMTNIVVALPNDSITGDFDTNYLNIIVPQSAISTTLVDDSTVAATNFVPIGSSGYYGAQRGVIPGTHTVKSSQPVGVQAYGFGFADAYGYFGGVVK